MTGNYKPDRLAWLELFDQEHRIEIDYPGMKKETWPYLVRFTRLGPGTNFITYFKPLQQRVAPMIRDQIEFFSEFDQPFHWKVYTHDQPGEIAAQLLAYGFKCQERSMVMFMDTEKASQFLLQPIDHQVRQVVELGSPGSGCMRRRLSISARGCRADEPSDRCYIWLSPAHLCHKLGMAGPVDLIGHGSERGSLSSHSDF